MSTPWSVLRQWAASVLRLLFPERCLLCRQRLAAGEHHVCAACFHRLPFTRFRAQPGNIVERIFWTHIPIVRASAYLRYIPGAESREIFFHLKYYDRPQIGYYFGRIMAADLCPTGFFEDIDLIVPLPLSAKRERRRGYNQSGELARGVSDYTGIPVERQLIARVVDNPSQTRKSPDERRENVRGIFRLLDADRLAGCHVLLIDDVITTGATVLSCARELARIEGVRISILALGLAGTHSRAGMQDAVPPA